MLVSVIIPTINRKGLLQRAIESVIAAAEYKKLKPGVVEVIVVNDSAESVTVDAFSNSLVPIRVISSTKAPFGGPSLARHAGILDSLADLVFFLDDDDYFLPNRFEYCLDTYLSDSDADVILEPSIRRDTRTDEEYTAGATSDVDNGFSWLLDGDESCHIATGATSFRRSSYFDVGGIDLNLKHGEDSELLLRLAYYKKLVFTYPDAVVVCERHDGNISDESKRRYFQNMNAISNLYKNTRREPDPVRDHILKHATRAKFSFLLSRCISDYSYPRRVYEALHVAYYFPWTWANRNSCKSLLVALFKLNYR